MTEQFGAERDITLMMLTRVALRQIDTYLPKDPTKRPTDAPPKLAVSRFVITPQLIHGSIDEAEKFLRPVTAPIKEQFRKEGAKRTFLLDGDGPQWCRFTHARVSLTATKSGHDVVLSVEFE